MYTVHIESTDNSWFGTGFMGIGAAAMLKRDPFYNTYIVFRPSGWVDNNGSVFRWCVVKDRQVIPVIGKCRQALEILGITLT